MRAWALAWALAASCCRLCPERVRTVQVVVERTRQCADEPPPGAVPLLFPPEGGCPAEVDVCLGPEGSMALAALYRWAVATWAKCGPAQPASAPAPR